MDEKRPTFSGVIVTPARMDIPTLPGRPLRPLGNSTVLGQWLKRARLVAPDIRLIVTTSDAKTDRPILEYCLEMGIPCLIAPTDDTSAHLEIALQSLGCESVAMCSLSNPFIEPALLRAAFEHFAESETDYVTFSGTPAGCAVEVLSCQAYSNFASGEYRGQPLTASVLPAPPLFFAPNLTFKCETEADYVRLVSLYSELLPNADGILGLADVIALVQEAEPLRRAA